MSTPVAVAEQYLTIASPELLSTCMSINNASNQNVMNMLYNGNLEYSGSLVSITASSAEYKTSVRIASHYDDFMQKPFPPNVWFKYKQEFREQFGRDNTTFIGWLYEDLEQWDPDNKFGIRTIRKVKDVNKQEQEIKTINENRVLYFQVAHQQAKIDRLEQKIQKLEKACK